MKVQALIRIRPISREEKRKGVKEAWSKIGDRGVIQHLNQSSVEVSGQGMFFDWVFSPEENNSSVFKHLTPVVEKVLEGSSICIIAYGQTASGKTHTMRGVLEGSPVDPGVIPRSISLLFSLSSQVASISFVEVYNECVYDLLGDITEGLQIREMPSGEIYVKDAREIEARTEREAQEIFYLGDRSRRMGKTKMNRESSRSHAVLRIKASGGGSAVFVDLAGSERQKQSQTEGKGFKEGAHINKSLLALTTVISKLSLKQAHIPFRNAKLTRILQPYLTEGVTVLICAVSPTVTSIEETVSTLALATRAKNIEIKPKPKSNPSKALREKKAIQSGVATVKKEVLEVKHLLERVHEEINSLFTEAAYIRSLSNPPQPSSPTNLQSKDSSVAYLSGTLEELKQIRESAVARLSELSSSVSYLLQQEKRLSESIRPPPPASILIRHLVEGDKLVQSLREEVRKLVAEKENSLKTLKDPLKGSRPSISLALELDRLKKSHQKEKRILQLKIAQLQSQINSLSIT